MTREYVLPSGAAKISAATLQGEKEFSTPLRKVELRKALYEALEELWKVYDAEKEDDRK